MPHNNIQNVLVVYKKSKYQIYFEESHWGSTGLEAISDEDKEYLSHAHKLHQTAMANVQSQLKEMGIRHRMVYRARRVDYTPFDFIITIGGDGTLIEAARCVKNQPILGINSDPDRSVGHFCVADPMTFRRVMSTVINGTAKYANLNRFALEIDGERLPVTVMNELLVAHHRPAAMSRYAIQVGDVMEEQLSSGVWVSTAAGSTGSIRSAGGKKMPLRSKRLQYLPRELFRGNGRQYQLTGQIVDVDLPVTIQSCMRGGEISLDGCRYRMRFGFGRNLRIFNAELPIRLVIDESLGSTTQQTVVP